MTTGYIQFTIPGAIENKGGVFGAVSDENTVAINGKAQLEDPSVADELTKLAALKRDGLISDDEYAQMKSKLINR